MFKESEGDLAEVGNRVRKRKSGFPEGTAVFSSYLTQGAQGKAGRKKGRIGGNNGVADRQARAAADEGYFWFNTALKETSHSVSANINRKFPTGLKNGANNGIIIKNIRNLSD